MILPVSLAKPRPLLVRLNWYWIFQLAGWSFVALVSIYFNAGHRTWRIIAIAWWSAGAGVLLSHGWHHLLRQHAWLERPLRWRRLVPGVMLSAGAQTTVVLAGYYLFNPFGTVDLTYLPSAWIYWIVIYCMWTFVYASVLGLRRANRFEAEALRLEIHAKDAELRALQAQVNPHFFFNSMNSVRALIYEDPQSAARMIDQLAAVMRYALQSGQTETVALAAELEAVQAYLAIEKIRFEERMQVSVDVDAGLEQIRIPPMALQTLVENAVKYGVEASASGSEIRIRARRLDDTVHIEIANLGAIPPFANSTKVGLVNTRKRLALALGARAQLDLSEHSGWVRATLTLPGGV
ncbi:histidine kinase [Oxalobacteraceae bacterium]|nr:histidine kinase [Oxalobacteraceae bacterium]